MGEKEILDKAIQEEKKKRQEWEDQEKQKFLKMRFVILWSYDYYILMEDVSDFLSNGFNLHGNLVAVGESGKVIRYIQAVQKP